MSKKLKNAYVYSKIDEHEIVLEFSDWCDRCGSPLESEQHRLTLFKNQTRVEVAEEIEKFAREIWHHI